MAKTLQLRRYTTSNLSSITGASGELIVDTTLNAITVHTGSNPGGFYTANAIVLQAAFTQANSAYGSQNVTGTYANSAYLAANGANANAITTGTYANAAFLASNTSVTLQSAINLTQNTSITAAFLQANTAFTTANTTNTNQAAINLTQNTSITAAFLQANTAATTVPQNRQSSNYVLSLSDAGKHLYYEASANLTVFIPTTSNVAFSNGQNIMVVSRTTPGANIIISPNASVSLFAAGNTISGNHNVTSYGVGTLIQVSANTWFISGTGVV